MNDQDKNRLVEAIRQMDEAKKTIKEIKAKLPGKNKTTAMYRLLGLCPQCGKEKTENDRFYCKACRMRHSSWTIDLHSRKRKARPTATSPQFPQYNNDDH